MVYDEGFELTLGQYKYFAFSRYAPSKEGGFNSIC
jgi:hypothetical protein